MRKGAAAHPHRRFSAKQSEPTPIDACCDRRQACDSICGTSTKFCDAELKSCADKACDDAPDKEECDRKKSMMQLMQSMDQGACKRHTDGQVAACKCVKPDEAPARRLKTIKEVYEKNGGDLCDQSTSVGCSCWLRRVVRNRHRHAIEQASRRTCRRILISTQAATRRRPRASRPRRTRPKNSALSCTSSWPSTRR